MKLWHRLDVIYSHEQLGQTEKHLAAYLAFRVREENQTARLGAGIIARDTGFDRRSVQRIINRLERIGLLSVQRSGKFQGRNAANLYTLRLVEIAAQRRYSEKGNSGTDDTGIAAQSPMNSGTAPHKPSEPYRNRGATDGARAKWPAPPRAERASTPAARDPDIQRRKLVDLAGALRIHRLADETESAWLQRVERVNAVRLAAMDRPTPTASPRHP